MVVQFPLYKFYGFQTWERKFHTGNNPFLFFLWRTGSRPSAWRLWRQKMIQVFKKRMVSWSQRIGFEEADTVWPHYRTEFYHACFHKSQMLKFLEVFDAVEKYKPEFSTDGHTNIPCHTLIFPYKVDSTLSKNGVCISFLNWSRTDILYIMKEAWLHLLFVWYMLYYLLFPLLWPNTWYEAT